MRSGFQKIVDHMEPLFQALLARPLHTVKNGLRNLPQRGVYAFYENDRAIYVGRSNRMRNRIREHGAENSRQGAATFAYKLTLEAAGEKGAIPQCSLGLNFKRGMEKSTRGSGSAFARWKCGQSE